jgi:hypothetical protein
LTTVDDDDDDDDEQPQRMQLAECRASRDMKVRSE